MRRFKKVLWRVGTVGLCLLMSIWMALDPWQLNRTMALAQQKAELEETRQQGLKELADRLEKMFDALEEAQREIPRDTFDPKVIIHGQPEASTEGIGIGAKDIFAWVRDNTYLVPYRGALRGHKGVLMDRLGNSLDRALLLAKLLRIAGHDRLRLWRAVLSEETAQRILDEASPIPEDDALLQQESSPEDLAEQLEKYAETYELDPAKLHASLDELNLKSQRLAVGVVQRTHEQSQALMELLQDEIDIPSAEEQRNRLREDAVDDYRHHWWLDYYDGSNWVTLDPTLPDAQPGDRVATDRQGELILTTEDLDDRKVELAKEADEQEKEDGKKDLVLNVDAAVVSRVEESISFEEALPWEYKHRVSIRVIIERWNDGQLEQLPVLEATLSPMAYLGERIALHHARHNWPPDFLKSLPKAESPQQELEDAVLAQKQWTPVLTAGDHRITNLSFTDAGQLNDANFAFSNVASAREISESLGKGAEDTGNAIGGLLSGRGGRNIPARDASKPTPVDEPDEEARLTAEWIEYAVFTPGNARTTSRREVFDLIRPSARETGEYSKFATLGFNESERLNRGFALLGHTSLSLCTTQLFSDFVDHLQLDAIQDNAAPFMRLLRTASLEDPHSVIEHAAPLTPFSQHLFAFALAQHEWDSFPAESYYDRPGIVAFHEYPSLNFRDELVSSQAFDIVTDGFATDHRMTGDPFVRNVTQGIRAANLEALLLSNSGGVENTAELFRDSHIQGMKWILIDGKDDPTLRTDSKLPDDVLARIRQDLAHGYLVVAPRSGIQVNDHMMHGWWRLAPRSGKLLGIGGKGWGQGSVESTEMLNESISQVSAVWDYVLCLHGAILGGGVRDPGSLGASNLQCLLETAKDQHLGHIKGKTKIVSPPDKPLAMKVHSLLTSVENDVGNLGKD